MAEDSVRFDVHVSAEAAVKELRKLLDGAETVDQKVVLFSKHLMDMSRQWGVPWRNLLTVIKQVNAELSKKHQQTLFGNIGGAPAFQMTEKFLASAEAANRFTTASNAATNATKGFNGEIQKTANGLEKAEASGRKFHNILNIIRGTLVAIGVFRIIEGVQEAFTGAVRGARELELSLYNLVNAERLLSEQGVGITPQDLKDITTEVQNLVPIFSRLDVSNAVAGIALFTKDLGLSKEQIEELSKSIAVLTVRNRAFGLSFEQVRSQVLTGILTGRAQGIRDLGVSVSETTIQAEALRLELVKDKAEFDSLTGEMEAHIKAQALISVITKSTAGEMDTLSDYLKTSDARIEANKAAWEDFLTTVGRGITNLIPDISGALEGLQKAVEVGRIQQLFNLARKQQGKSLIGQLLSAQDNLILQKLNLGLALTQKEYDKLKETLQELSPDEILNLFPDPSAIKDRFTRELVQSLVPAVDTATASLQNLADNGFGAIEEALGKVNMDDFLDDIEELNEKVAEMEREFQEKMTRMKEDFDRDQERDLQDYNNDVADTIQDFNDKRHDAEQKYRLQEAEAEARFQETLRQLREKFLFSLEDALRERDARQVLRLIREYNMEKENLTNEERLRKEFAAKQHAEEMARLRREEAERLAELDREFQLKQQRAQQDYETKKAREIEEHQQDMEDLRDQIADRLEEFSEEIAKELGLREGGADAIYEVLKKYYGENGLFDGLYNYSIASASARAKELLEILSTLAGQMMSQIPSLGIGGTHNFTRNSDYIGGQASGGIYYADKPTTATFGEAGPEMAAFLPIKNAKQGMKLAGGLGGGGSMGGNLSMRIMLSHGLVAEIVDQSLENVSTIIEEVQRNR